MQRICNRHFKRDSPYPTDNYNLKQENWIFFNPGKTSVIYNIHDLSTDKSRFQKKEEEEKSEVTGHQGSERWLLENMVCPLESVLLEGNLFSWV